MKGLATLPSKRWCANWLAKAGSDHALRPVKRLEKARIDASRKENVQEFLETTCAGLNMARRVDLL
jgi:hypothetical protein